MAKQKYRLQPVLDVRDRAKEAAAQSLTARRQQLTAAEAEMLRRERAVAACRDRQSAAREQMLAAADGRVEVHALVAHRTHLADLRQSEQELLAEVERQRAVVRSAEAEVEKAVAELIEASKESRVIEMHRESWREGVRREEERRSQKAGDEFAIVTHERRRQE